MSESLTISRLALNIYFNKYLKDSKILLIKKYDMFDFINYGGITEIYKPYAEESYYYDVNSLYPHVSNIKLITENKYLVTFITQPSKETCLSYNLDYEKVIRQDYKWGMESSNDFTDVSIVISAMITSYARIYMNKIKLDILNKGGQIYYMDTDSIVTNIQLPNHIVGIELGKFKLEYKIKKAYFISNKTYCLLSNEDKVIIKFKGVINDKLKILKICIIIKLTLKLLKVIQKLIIVKGM